MGGGGHDAVIKHAQDVTISLIKHAQKQIWRKSSVMKINYRNYR